MPSAGSGAREERMRKRWRSEKEMESSSLGLSFTLRHHNSSDGNACNQVAGEPGKIVARQPLEKGKETDPKVFHLASIRNGLADPLSDRWVGVDVRLGVKSGSDAFSAGDSFLVIFFAVMEGDAEDTFADESKSIASFLGGHGEKAKLCTWWIEERSMSRPAEMGDPE